MHCAVCANGPVKENETDAVGSPVNCHAPFPWLVQLPRNDRRESVAPTVWFAANAGCAQHMSKTANSVIRRAAARGMSVGEESVGNADDHMFIGYTTELTRVRRFKTSQGERARKEMLAGSL
jgi:hypothetical protein